MTPHTRKSSPLSQSSLKSFEGLVVGAGVAPAGFFEQLRSDLALIADPVRAVNNLHRFLSSGFSTAILRDFQAHPILQRLALELFAQSQYLADILVRDPGLFRWLTTSNVLKVAKSRSEYLSEAQAAVQLFSRMEKRFDALKRFHRREILRIGAREILKESEVVVITKELSALADAVVQSVLEIGHQDLVGRTGAEFKNALGVIGLGKLGGNELNFSSDIDLLFVYDQDGEFHAPQERIRTYHEYYNRLAEFIVRQLTEFSGEGRLYRVDMRLRPEGSAGPLALSRAAYMLYYETRGELWERQMMLKARPVAGNAAVCQRLVDDLQPFVFPRTFFTSPVDEIAKMKQRIEAASNSATNIKLGEGGIRDIEFITQVLQLLNGGGERSLRTPNTLEALERLREKGRISAPDKRFLSEAYKLFRVVEHRLQLLHGMQTHTIPAARAETDLLAKRLGYKTTIGFEKEIQSHRKRVRRIFASVFKISEQKEIRDRALEVLNTPSLSGLRLIDEPEALKNATALITNLPSLGDEESWECVVRGMRKHGSEDWALKNLLALSESPAIRRTLAQAMINADVLDLLCLLCSRSSYCSQTLAREPLLFESLVGQPKEFFGDSWSWGLMRENDLLRYKVYNEFKFLLRFLIGQLTIGEVTSRLSDLADLILLQILNRLSGEAMAVVALGKLGGKEITFGSDLDLIFLYDEERVDFQDADRGAKLLVDQIASAGIYALDFRLRPEGKNAPLATGIRYYIEYLNNRASLWEKQSLTKARVLWGEESLAKRIADKISETISVLPLPARWTTEIRSMRKRIEKERTSKIAVGSDLKAGKGGLVDLEFLIQALQLRSSEQHKHILIPNSFDALQAIGEAGLIKKSEADQAKGNLQFLRILETLIRLNSESTEFVLPKNYALMRSLAVAAGEKSVQRLKTKIRNLRSQNRRLLHETLRRVGER